MSSQILAIFYLNDLDHYIKEKLKISKYVRYQDDFLLFHESKKYLKECLEKIKIFFKNEKLELNPKTRLYNSNNNFIFLGRNKFGKYAKYRNVKRRIKKKDYMYKIIKIRFYNYVCTRINYKNLMNKR